MCAWVETMRGNFPCRRLQLLKRVIVQRSVFSARLAVVTVSRNARLHGLRCAMSALAMLRSCSRRVSADRGAAV